MSPKVVPLILVAKCLGGGGNKSALPGKRSHLTRGQVNTHTPQQSAVTLTPLQPPARSQLHASSHVLDAITTNIPTTPLTTASPPSPCYAAATNTFAAPLQNAWAIPLQLLLQANTTTPQAIILPILPMPTTTITPITPSTRH